MALPIFTFCPEFGAREVRAPRTSPFKFGNGKERRYRFGLVTDLRTWELSFDYNTDARREQILAFLEERGAWKVFEWTDPKGYFARWRCKEWNTTWNGHNQHSITCTFVEVDERVAAFVPPEPVVAPDMWASRLDTDTDQGPKPSSVQVCPDGSSYQVAYIRLASDPSRAPFVVVFRDKAGVVQWQRRMDDVYRELSLNRPPGDHFNLEIGPNDELFVVTATTFWERIDSNDVATGSNASNTWFHAFCIERSGSLRWQKYHSLGFQHTVWDTLYDPILSNLIVFVGNLGYSSGNSGNTAHVFRISPSSGAVVASKRLVIAMPDFGSILNVAPFVGVIRNARLFLIGNGRVGGSVWLPFIIELSLDLNTVFQAYHYQETEFAHLIPASDGGWYMMARKGTGSSKDQIIKFNASFAPVWRQVSATSLSFIANRKRMKEKAKTVSGRQVYTVAGEPDGSFLDPWTAIPRVKSWSGNLTSTTTFYEHESERAGFSATSARPVDFTPGDRTDNSTHSNDAYCPTTNTTVFCHSNHQSTQRARNVVFGYKAAMEDEGERWLDTGLNISSSFFMVARSQLDGQFQPVTESSEPALLPVRVAWTPTKSTVSVTSGDCGFPWTESFFPFAHYSYLDPEFTEPATDGDGGLAFYTGNNAVQKVNVGRAFTPSLVFHASRSNAGPLANPGIKHLFSGQAGWSRFCRIDSAVTHGTTPDGVLEAGTGYFKISGRKVSTVQNWNELSVEYAALALGLLAGGHTAVTYTGNGASSQSVAHELGVAPELVFLFPHVNSASLVAGSSFLPAGQSLLLDSTAAAAANSNRIQSIDSSAVTVGGTSSGLPNASGVTWTMHLFASSDAWDIGTFQGAGTGTHTQSLGYQPRALILKNIIGGTGNWWLLFREDDTPGVARAIPLNTTAAEAASTDVSLTADGFTVLQGGTGNTGTVTAFYFAIR